MGRSVREAVCLHSDPMETARAIATLRAVRAFDGRTLDDEDVQVIVQAGRRAPSSKNTQRWEFVVCRDREHLADLAGVGPFAGHLARAGAGVALVAGVGGPVEEMVHWERW